MSWFDYFRSTRESSARTAKERLQIVIAHERIDRHGPSYLPTMRQDIIDVIRKYVAVDEEQVKIQMEHEGDMDVLALNIHLPEEERLPPIHHQRVYE